MSTKTMLQVRKIIKAKRQRVFEAWTKPELMMKWYAPGEMKTPSASSDLKIGGAYRVEMKGPMGGEIVNPTVRGTYQKIVQNELVSFTWRWDGDDSPETLVTVELKDVDGGTEVILTHERFPSSEEKDKHQHGWIGCLENLAKFLNQ
jgi:uncharacterized protein YndB with AHSA1/START domain